MMSFAKHGHEHAGNELLSLFIVEKLKVLSQGLSRFHIKTELVRRE